MRTSVSLPSLFSESKLFSSQQQLETARSEFKVRLLPDKNPSDQVKQSRSLIRFQQNAQGFASFRTINSQKMDEILNSLKGMRSGKTNLGQSIKAQILFNKRQYAKIQDYCGKRRQEEKERVVSRLAKLEPLPMKKEVKATDKNKKTVKTTVGFRINLNYEIYETNRVCWKPFIDFDAMPVALGYKVYFIAGRSRTPLTHYDRQKDKWIQEQPIENIKPFGQSEGTVISDNEVLFFGGSKFFVMGESQVSNNLTYVNLQTKQAQIVQFDRDKVEGRCFHGQCIYGDFLLVSGGINSKNQLLNSFSAYHLTKHYWFQLTIDKLDPTLKQGFAKHKMMTIMHPRLKYNIYQDQPVLVSKEEKQSIKHEGIYFFGGEDNNVELSNRLYILKMGQPSLEVFQPKIQGQPPFPRKNFGWLRVRQFLFIQGGRNDEMRPWVLGALNALNLKTMTWVWVKGDKPTLRHSHALLQYGEQIVILGGKNIEGLCKEVCPIKFEEVIEYI